MSLQNDTVHQVVQSPRETELQILQGNVVRCTRCPELVTSRQLYPYGKPTFGYGNPNSVVVFVGEAPGKDGCGTTGIPFTRDRSGQYYQRLLNEELEMKFEDVYTTNVVKCCPEENRQPTNKECYNCLFFLIEELKIVRPKIIVPLGRTASKAFVIIVEKFSNYVAQELSSQLPVWCGVSWDPIIFPLWHPAFPLRQPEYEESYRKHWRLLRDLIHRGGRQGRQIKL